MDFVDKGTVIRTAILILALVNQMLVMFGKSPIPIESELIEQLISVLFTVTTSLVAWYKNNYVTKTGQKQKEVLQEKGLTNNGRKKK